MTAPVGAAGTFLISYIRKTDRAITNDNSSQAAIGYIHNLSKRTALYTSYGELRNDGAAKNQSCCCRQHGQIVQYRYPSLLLIAQRSRRGLLQFEGRVKTALTGAFGSVAIHICHARCNLEMRVSVGRQIMRAS
ncbi:porin [Undibacterium arcticum]